MHPPFMQCSPHQLRCATLNVRGLSERKRQSQVYRLFNERDLDVVAVQETKVETEQSTERMVGMFTPRYEVCVSHAVGSSAGCLILIRRSSGVLVQKVTSSLSGRLVSCDFILASREWRIVCVYAPTKGDERKVFFEELREWFDTERVIVLLGDFNCVCSARDKSSSAPYRDASTVALNSLISDFGLEDVGDVLECRTRVQFTHFQGTSHARLDRAYVSLELVPECSEYTVTPVSCSDHCLVSFFIGKSKDKKNKFNWDLWKMNSLLLKDEEFQTEVKKRLRTLKRAELADRKSVV